jgi:hypothetical protein
VLEHFADASEVVLSIGSELGLAYVAPGLNLRPKWVNPDAILDPCVILRNEGAKGSSEKLKKLSRSVDISVTGRKDAIAAFLPEGCWQDRVRSLRQIEFKSERAEMSTDILAEAAPGGCYTIIAGDLEFCPNDRVHLPGVNAADSTTPE